MTTIDNLTVHSYSILLSTNIKVRRKKKISSIYEGIYVTYLACDYHIRIFWHQVSKAWTKITKQSTTVCIIKVFFWFFFTFLVCCGFFRPYWFKDIDQRRLQMFKYQMKRVACMGQGIKYPKLAHGNDSRVDSPWPILIDH